MPSTATRATGWAARKWAQPRHEQSSVARGLRNVGLAGWFGGALMSVLAVSRGAQQIREPTERGEFLAGTYRRWGIPGTLAIAAHLAGSTSLGWSGRHRAPLQQGMPTAMTVDTAATALALGATVLAGVRRRRAVEALRAGDRDGSAGRLERRWLRTEPLVPVLTAVSLAAQAKLAEQQRPVATAKGVWARLRPGG